MNKLREKLEECLFESNGHCGGLSECEQITDDFTLKFVRWHSVNKYELPNELTLEEKLQIFKTQYYE